MTATITKPIPKKSVAAAKPQSPYKRLHVIIPIEDMLWASQQKHSVTQLWQECWTADPYGSRWMPLTSALGYSTFIYAKKILSQSGLFIFKPDKSIEDGRETVRWMVQNLHGSRIKEFWEEPNSASPKPDAQKQQSNAQEQEVNAVSEEMRASNQASISGQRQSEQGFGEPSRTHQEHLTNSPKEFVRCISDTLKENLHPGETAHAPLRGASPPVTEGVSEKEEELPTAMDCSSLLLVDDVQGESVLLSRKNQDFGDEVRDSHEGDYSAAPVAPHEFSPSQVEGQVEPSQPTSSMIENSVSGQEVKSNHQGKGCAAPMPNAEKWSNEAIITRQNQRPARKQKLNLAVNSGLNPGFEFLKECWNDPALLIIVKKLLTKYPQWGVAVVDGVLVKWDE